MTAPMHAASLLPPAPARVHFVGIGGIGMSGLARILRAWGYDVTGSDASASEQTRLLAGEGIPVTIGHADIASAAAADLVVVTAAVRSGNPEVDAAIAAGVRVIKRAVLLGMLADARTHVAVAGSHGKSSTSGMLVAALSALGASPSYAVGAIVAATGSNAAPGNGSVMVVEADEYDYSFLQLHPDIAIVTNIEYDHPDLFPDQAAYDAAFARFAANLRAGGALILAADDPGCARLLERLPADLGERTVTFGENAGADWRLVVGETATVRPPVGNAVELSLRVPGRHNLRNATAALIALDRLGFAPDAAARALATYAGVGRRFEVKGEAGGIVVVDDYAHHPTEIDATLRAARERYPARRLVAAFQPHTFSRTKILLAEFAAALGGADVAAVLDIYPSRESDDLGISSADLLTRIGGDAVPAGKPEQAVAVLGELTRPGDVVLTIGAGDVTNVGPALLAALRERGGETAR